MSSFKLSHECIQVLLLCSYTDMLMHTDTQTGYKSSWCKKQNEWTMNHIHILWLIQLKYLFHTVIYYGTQTHYYVILSLTFANT